ncbi:4-hydroxy-tetrahydrodipicolinate reductase [Ornithinibacillus sp. 4-3]|uniref:4-hydroxy-tetrahydrodipicolinate reductase n=1 Tax=Ornithinibacillus sp. 4-3 TaxID=3231488 RepID=A0AB39HN27_9BACI
MTIKIVLAGPRGKMGTEAIEMILKEPKFALVACIDRKNAGEALQKNNLSIPIFDDADTCFDSVEADVFIDLTNPEAGFHHTKTALNHKIRAVVGTSGFSTEQINELSEMAETHHTGCIIAPNFAIGAILMMQFSKMAAKFFPDVEIIEKHHDQKMDAPSGTGVKTAQLIQENRESKKQGHPNEIETVSGSRGGDMDGIRIHSVRLPGLVAHQEVIFGGAGQTLSIKHDSLNRLSFMDGIHYSVLQVMKLDQLIYGLENLIEL